MIALNKKLNRYSQKSPLNPGWKDLILHLSMKKNRRSKGNY
jgi:hypothetical protein